MGSRTGMVGAARALEPAGCVELARLERSGLVESRHLGAAAVVDASGRVLRAVGDTSATVYPRSTLKPLQAIAMLEAGARFTDEQLVLATASHCGSALHLAVVEGMLAEDGRTGDDLQCPVEPPLGSRERAERAAAGLPATRVTMNCSGKHAGFLRASDALGADARQYLNVEHPVQRRVTETIAQWTGEPVHRTAVDGCGAPLHATSLAALGRGIARVGTGHSPHAAALMSAVLAQPWAIDGVGRANTVVVERLGLLAKIGAEGLLVLASSQGVAVAVKMLDGGMRATTPVALALLAAEGVVDSAAADEVAASLAQPVRGGGEIVGGLVVTL
ncbi:MAG: asparaginase [Microcella sp.]|uniref:asparaginase n=1 Tax=Microcella sp. TaxID=1913979 RepID=UPI003315BB4B